MILGNCHEIHSVERQEQNCPLCGLRGLLVPNVTVKNLVKPDVVNEILDNDYYICLNPPCSVVYFYQGKSVFTKEKIKVPVWFKEGAEPKYVCYCNKVTAEDIMSAVVKQGARDLKSIMEITGAMKEGKCLVNNPTGKCCHNEIKKIVNDALKRKR